MSETYFEERTPQAARNQQLGSPRSWLWLALLSLIVPGLTALLLVALRSLAVDVGNWTAIFRSALVVHVDLSVFVWFMAVAGLLWSLRPGMRTPKTPWVLAAIGALCIAAAPLFGGAEPVLNNYIPVLRHPLFFFGLGLFALGMLSAASRGMQADASQTEAIAEGWILRAAAFTTGIAAIVFVHTFARVPHGLIPEQYFETLFWGTGHLLQFVYGLLLLFAWLRLAMALDYPLPQNGTVAIAVVLSLAPLSYAAWLELTAPILSGEYRLGYSALMRWGNAWGPLLIGLPLVWQSLRNFTNRLCPHQRPIRMALLSSFVVFAVGGGLGYAIQETNTVVPAHYHGSIVGVTLALMGLIYSLMPRLGYAPVSGHIAAWQPAVYALGQLMHVAGLALQAAPRKTVGVEVDALGALATQLTRWGGGIAVLGGILFLWACWRAMRR
jgi:cytochrome c oxidase subunit 1